MNPDEKQIFINTFKLIIMCILIKRAVHESRDSEKVVKFINVDELPLEVQKLIDNGSIHGLYYSDGVIVAEDIWGDVHKTQPSIYCRLNQYNQIMKAGTILTYHSSEPGLTRSDNSKYVVKAIRPKTGTAILQALPNQPMLKSRLDYLPFAIDLVDLVEAIKEGIYT